MAAITTIQAPNGYRITRTTASAFTDWLTPPAWAKYCQIFLTPTAITTNLTLALVTADPGKLDDTFQMGLREIANFTAITAANITWCIDIGPGITGIADDITVSATADSYVSINCILPRLLGLVLTPSGSATYTASVDFRA
jgi:hypothetical protein